MSNQPEPRIPLPGTASDWTSIGNGLLTPVHFTDTAEADDECPYDVELTIEVVNHRPRCREVTISAHDGQAVTSAGLRTVKLHELVARVTAGRTLTIRETAGGGWAIGPPSADELSGAYAVASDAPDRDLAAVARVYAEAIDTGQPTEAVRATFNISKSTAQRRVREARAAGFPLPSAPRRPREGGAV